MDFLNLLLIIGLVFGCSDNNEKLENTSKIKVVQTLPQNLNAIFDFIPEQLAGEMSQLGIPGNPGGLLEALRDASVRGIEAISGEFLSSNLEELSLINPLERLRFLFSKPDFFQENQTLTQALFKLLPFVSNQKSVLYAAVGSSGLEFNFDLEEQQVTLAIIPKSDLGADSQLESGYLLSPAVLMELIGRQNEVQSIDSPWIAIVKIPPSSVEVREDWFEVLSNPNGSSYYATSLENAVSFLETFLLSTTL